MRTSVLFSGGKDSSLSAILMERIYLDYQNGTPEAPNPSSLHAEGRGAARFLGEARAHLADLIACSPAEIIFTSGGTESNESNS